ncbi:hypothetical protein LCGC14_2566050, partial [marine sediment metagenome]
MDYPDSIPFVSLLEMTDVKVKSHDASFAYNCEPLRPDNPLILGPDIYVCEGYN